MRYKFIDWGEVQVNNHEWVVGIAVGVSELTFGMYVQILILMTGA